MKDWLRKARGFTLIELIIVLAVLGVLAAIVVPNVAGYLEQGKDRSFAADEQILQAAVDAWRTDFRNRAGNAWPTMNGSKGNPVDANTDGDFLDVGDTNTIIKISDLNTGNFIKGTDAVKSFKYDVLVTGATGATNTSGSYYWFVDTSGKVTGWYDANDDLVLDSGETGYETGVYP